MSITSAPDNLHMKDNECNTEQELLVYLDFDSILLPEELNDPNLTFKIIGIETDNPIVQVNSKIFKGEYDYSVGTHVFFSEDPEHPPMDPLYNKNPEMFYKHAHQTNKVLRMKRIFVEKIDDMQTKDEDVNDLTNYKVTKTYQQALNQLLKPGQKPPRKARDILDTKIETSKKLTAAEENGASAESDIDDIKDEDYIPSSARR